MLTVAKNLHLHKSNNWTAAVHKAIALMLVVTPLFIHNANAKSLNEKDINRVSPTLAEANTNLINNELWQRPGLSGRDRSLVTLAALIARDQTEILAEEFSRALDNGVTAGEISEVINHLAYYAGWGNAMNAVQNSRKIFAERKIKTEDLPAINPKLLPLNEAAEKARADFVDGMYGATSAGVVQYTTDVLFRDLWLRPGLAPRDRSLITVSALIAAGQPEQVTFHLNKAMDNGLADTEASEMLTQLAFYAGWPKVFSALPVVKKVLEERGE